MRDVDVSGSFDTVVQGRSGEQQKVLRPCADNVILAEQVKNNTLHQKVKAISGVRHFGFGVRGRGAHMVVCTHVSHLCSQ